MRIHFLHSGHPIKRLGRSRGSDVASRRIALCTHYLPSDVLKSEYGDVDEAIFQGFGRPCKLILCIVGFQKSDLDELAKVTFQVGEWPLEIIICLLDVLKSDFSEVDETMFQVLERS
jgi:hypothetical protein